MNVTEHSDTVSPTGLTMVNVIEHGGHETGTVGLTVTGTDELVSRIFSLPFSKFLCNKENGLHMLYTSCCGPNLFIYINNSYMKYTHAESKKLIRKQKK